ncbi:Transmembrane protein 62 [Portunus trituberculatus]|uniref:Transmembrane protein 62 n=1 Tax=Portunus trituberculatus TaxID=210409 RepID=A0A5B7DK46_PORTR|nr:Transmembrane protein 62 [Portunus trituberculatus]
MESPPHHYYTISEARAKGEVVVFYGHYPSNSIVSPRDVKKLLSLGVAYLCGHLHTAFGFLDPMWTRHSSGLLEVELADWYRNHRFRILSVDNDRVNWVDVVHPSWPVVMVARVQRYTMGHGAFRYMLKLLVFSNEEVLSVSVRVDDNLGHWITCQHRSGPLYTATVDIQLEAWDPQISEKDFVKTLQWLTLQLPVFAIIFLKKMLSYESARHRCGKWLVLGMGVTLAGQVPGILAWLILDSILLNGPLRLLLSLLAIVLWKL